jgi:hypothetical protein
MFLIELKEASARRNIYRKRMENKIEKAPAERNIKRLKFIQ